jgi:integrase
MFRFPKGFVPGDHHSEKTGRPVQFELTDQTWEAVGAWIESGRLGEWDYLFPSRVHTKPHLSTRQYSVVERWVSSIGLDPKRYGTHSMRRTKAAHIYKKTGNLPRRPTLSRP